MTTLSTTNVQIEIIDTLTGKTVQRFTRPDAEQKTYVASCGWICTYINKCRDIVGEAIETDGGMRSQARFGHYLVYVYELEPVAEVEAAVAAVVAEALAVEATNALGEPMPASNEENIARQLVNELSEMHTFPASYNDARYEAKSDRVRALGFDIGPDGQGGLCLYDVATQRPLHPVVAAVVEVEVAPTIAAYAVEVRHIVSEDGPARVSTELWWADRHTTVAQVGNDLVATDREGWQGKVISQFTQTEDGRMVEVGYVC